MQAEAEERRVQGLKRFESEKVHRKRALAHERVTDAIQKKEAFRQQQLPGKPPEPVGVLALRPDRSTLLPRHVPGSARDVTMRELRKVGLERLVRWAPKDRCHMMRVLPLQTTVGDILTGIGAMRVRAKQRARLQTPSLPTHGSTQMLSMFEEAKTQPVTATTLALTDTPTLQAPTAPIQADAPPALPEAEELDQPEPELVSTIGESEVASTVPIGPEIGNSHSEADCRQGETQTSTENRNQRRLR